MGYFETLKVEIILRSVPTGLSFIDARDQWFVESKCKVSYDDGIKCLCGYPHIVYLNRLRNSKTNEIVIVGSCCVKQFEFKELEVCCMECNKRLPDTNKFVSSLLNNHIVLTKKTKIVGHKKCYGRINYNMSMLCNRDTHIFTFNERSKYIVNYFGGMIRSIWDKPEGIEISYKENCEDYLMLVIGQYLQ